MIRTILLTSIVWLLPALSQGQFLVIDPGHGGPGASKFGSNGGGHNEYRGNSGNGFGLTEQWVNLRVGLTLDSLIRGAFMFPPIMTRTTEDTNVSYQERVDAANDNFLVDAFLSIHHNGLDSLRQATEVRWCDAATNGSGTLRDTSALNDIFARKARYNLLESIRYADRCSTLNQGNPMQGCIECGSIFVVRNVNRPHVLTEASNLDYREEEALFLDGDQHIVQEATALLKTWQSFLSGQGFGRLEYRYIGPGCCDLPPLYVDGELRYAPFERSWGLGEYHTFEAASQFSRNGYNYTFVRWEEVEYSTGTLWSTNSSRSWSMNVQYASDGYHYFQAVYKGGPFNFNLQSPFGGVTRITPDTTYTIRWTAPPTSFKACSLRVEFSSNNGASYSQLAGPVPYWQNENPDGFSGSLSWHVPNQNLTACKLRLRAWDYVGNMDTVISHTFTIAPPACSPLPYADARSGGTPTNIYPYTYYWKDFSTGSPTVWLWDFGDGTTSNLKDPSHRFYAGTYWVRLQVWNACGTSIDSTGPIQIFPCAAPGPDTDGDGRTNLCDNCDFVDNPLQEDDDNDGMGNACCCVGPVSGNVDGDPNEVVVIGDLTRLIDYMFLSNQPLSCPGEADMENSALDYRVDVGDLGFLVEHLFVSNLPLLPCNQTNAYVSEEDLVSSDR